MDKNIDEAGKLARKILEAGIAFQEPELIQSYYNSMKGIFVAGLSQGDPLSGMYLDLNVLPSQPLDLKMIFIKWLIQVNLPRIKQGLEPIMPLSVALKCPLWKVVPAPVRKIALTQEGMFGKPSAKTLGKQSKVGAINKRK